MHPRLALNSLSTASWPLERDLELYAQLGVGAAGFYFDKLEAVGLSKAIDLVTSSGVRATQLFTRGPTLHDPARWPDEQGRLSEAVDVARFLGAPWVGITSGAAGDLDWDAAVGALGDALLPVLGAAAERGVRLAIEQTLPVRVEIGFVHSLWDSIDVARTLGLGVTMECGYCFRERGVEDAVRTAAAEGLLAVVQLSDLVPPSTMIPDRAVPGDGVIPLGRLIERCAAAGYDGAFELELLGPRIEGEGYESAVRRAITAVDAILCAVL